MKQYEYMGKLIYTHDDTKFHFFRNKNSILIIISIRDSFPVKILREKEDFRLNGNRKTNSDPFLKLGKQNIRKTLSHVVGPGFFTEAFKLCWLSDKINFERGNFPWFHSDELFLTKINKERLLEFSLILSNKGG